MTGKQLCEVCEEREVLIYLKLVKANIDYHLCSKYLLQLASTLDICLEKFAPKEIGIN